MIVVGLTGSLASGKSEAAKIFKKLGARIYDADAAAKKAVAKGAPAYKAIQKIFGKEYFDKKGELNRRKLAERVFNNPKDLQKLNVLIHPGVIFESLQAIGKVKGKPGVFVLDVPLLFESKMENLADCTVLVRATQAQMLERAVKKGLARELAKKILSTQWSMEKKSKLADFVIDNDGSTADLERKIRDVFKKIKSQPGGNT